MPRHTRYPRLRSHSWKTARGEVRTAYYYDMRPDGKRDIALGTDFDEAVRKWDELHNRKRQIVGRIQEAIDRWKVECLPAYASATTRRNYAQNLRRIEPVFGPASWEQVKVSTIAEYLTKRSAKVQANREKALLSVIWGKARLWGMTELPFPAFRMALKNPERAADVDVSDEAFAALYAHADPLLRDALDLASATGLRIRDILALRVSDIRGTRIVGESASKTGKAIRIDLPADSVVFGVLERRRAMKAQHVFLLACGNKPVSERQLQERFARARAAASVDCPEVSTLLLRYMRKRAAQLAPTLGDAQELLQHSSASTTARHYRPSRGRAVR